MINPDQLLTAVGVAVAAIGLSLTFLQLMANARESFADRRPYVIVSLKLEKKTGLDDSVYIEILNSGETPARDITLAFEEGKAFHYVKQPNYPFLKEYGGLEILAPGETNRYFLGRLSKTSDLNILKTDEIEVYVTYSAYRGVRGTRTLKDKLKLSLRVDRYMSK